MALPGAQEPVRDENVTVGTSSVSVALWRTVEWPRVEMVLRNVSSSATAIISISFGMQTPSNNAGIVLKQNETYTMAQDAGPMMFQGTINAIANEAGTSLAIHER